MPSEESSPSHDQAVLKAIAATAACSILVAGILFFFFFRFVMARKRQTNKFRSSFRREAAVLNHQECRQQGRTLKGVIIDENGLDVLYLRKLEGGQLTSCFSKVWFDPGEEEKRVDSGENKPKTCEYIQEIPLLHEPFEAVDFGTEAKTAVGFGTEAKSAPPMTIPTKKIPLPPPPPPVSTRKVTKPPPIKIPEKINPAPPPPPSRAGGLVSSLKPPTLPKGKDSSNIQTMASTGESNKGNGELQMKMKPLHWDKVIANVDHSLVWDDINDGSFRFDDDLLEALFGYEAIKQKSEASKVLPGSGSSNSSQTAAQVFILDPRKSQNTAIVLKSLAVSRKEIIDALLEGGGLGADTLEKLTKISPTQEESAKILQFNGNPTKLADAESFLYHILKAIPSAFIRIDAMLFRSNYDAEILHLKESLQTLELGCKELRTRGIFLKLLEAILKAGNRMNAGTARGNAQGFNLSSLQKLSNVKSTDGKTTLLHFVVEQVVRSEGKRCAINRSHSLGRSNSQSSQNSDGHADNPTEMEKSDKEYLLLGLPVLGGLSTVFSNVKKAANIDHDSYINMCSSLTVRVSEIRQVVTCCGNGERGGFVREMQGFLKECEAELMVVRDEQIRVMELVKRTTDYYQAGAFKDNGSQPHQIFLIVKDFLDMVDQVRIDITRILHKKNVTGVVPSPPLSPSMTSERFQNLHLYFMPEKQGTSSSSESDDYF